MLESLGKVLGKKTVNEKRKKKIRKLEKGKKENHKLEMNLE